ncbi:hypothetical protein [uncultured Novosphingobium sp.]|uniref:hypothetical protein n=1 Tax=uncultured Novosphingobium sp. TaxID=292277 RepID=UPI002588BC72|nr:hypothetical protein [uncultured Novosphingobium sp.]
MTRLSPAAMTKRLVLTLLALLTGLAAQLAPANARVCAAQTAPAAIVAPVAQRLPAAPVELARLPEAGRRHARMVADGGAAFQAFALFHHSVLIGIDRARQ